MEEFFDAVAEARKEYETYVSFVPTRVTKLSSKVINTEITNRNLIDWFKKETRNKAQKSKNR